MKRVYKAVLDGKMLPGVLEDRPAEWEVLDECHCAENAGHFSRIAKHMATQVGLDIPAATVEIVMFYETVQMHAVVETMQ